MLKYALSLLICSATFALGACTRTDGEPRLDVYSGKQQDAIYLSEMPPTTKLAEGAAH